FLPHLREGDPGTRLSNLDYAPISEQLGKVGFASEVLNCAAPDTGNMEILNLYGSDQIREEWLKPLLNGEIRSAFAMTARAAASPSRRRGSGRAVSTTACARSGWRSGRWSTW